MLNLKNAARFVYKSPFMSLVVFLAILVSVGVQFFILSLGTILDFMIIDQTTSYQDHIIARDILTQTVLYEDLDFGLKDQILANDSNVKYVNYFLNLDSDIIEVDNESITPSIKFNIFGYDNYYSDNNFLNYTGLSEEKHLLANSRVLDPTKNEIMLDVNFARDNDLTVGQLLTFKLKTNNEIITFEVVGIYDLGIYKTFNSFTFLPLDHFSNLSNNNFSLNVQLNNADKTSYSIDKMKEILPNKDINYKTWKDVVPEVSVLNDAQKIVILLIEIFISAAFFIVILNVLNYIVKQKYHQFGILKAMGQTKSDIRNTIVLQTLIIAILGIIVGLIGGAIGIKTYGNLMTYPDGSPRFHVGLNFINFSIPFLLTITSALLASLIAYLKIKNLSIIDLIKE